MLELVQLLIAILANEAITILLLLVGPPRLHTHVNMAKQPQVSVRVSATIGQDCLSC
jgi:hypothetical protein